jgi:hypothetical protein
LGSGEADDEFWQIAQVAFANAPDEMLKAVLLVIDRENAQGSTLFVLRRLANCWSGPIAAALLQKLEDASLKASCWGEILSELLGRDVNEAFQYAFGIAASESREGVLDTQHRLKAVVALLAHGGRRGWEMAWPVIEHDAELGPAALTEFAHSAEQRLSGHISVELTDLELGRVFKVLMTYFPPGTDVDRSGEGAYLVSPRDSVTEFRNSLLRRLQERGTADSLLVLEQTVKEFPDSTWLKWALVEARKIAVERAWHPLTPQEFLGAFEKSA